MKSSKGNTQEEEEEYEEDFSAKMEGTSSNKDAKNNEKANAIRSKHSVTEQRRRSKINERFQILRDLVPHGDQKRDTASFLLEVIDYVQLLQEKVLKYEGSYQGWSTEPTKLMPWRHSHWRVQSFLGHPQTIRNSPGETFSGKLDEKSISINPSLAANSQTPLEPGSTQDTYRAMDQPSELVEKTSALPMPFQVDMPTPIQSDDVLAHPPKRPTSDAQSTDYSVSNDNQQEEHMIEGGTISISSAYSHELLTTLTQALQSSGVDLSQASISVRIDLGKRANRSLVSGTSSAKDHENPVSCTAAMAHYGDGSSGEELDQAQKRMKT
ncbi:hypothetical protein Nepgr_003658 [Nepenthes gracilis]|uniref:BHLH domain-containing protein n=1 Tax=Nepenthes gracilis TaxID=150966 RepID=A0AAD3S024_NEPGR|nr:hypothetical protein Nepgr_003658 [Nepenthes gracilis]